MKKLTLFHAGITLEYSWNSWNKVIPVVFLLQTGKTARVALLQQQYLPCLKSVLVDPGLNQFLYT